MAASALPAFSNTAPRVDWLTQTVAAKAALSLDAATQELVLDNGLIRRRFHMGQNLASTELKHLQTGESFLRATTPECVVVVDGKEIKVGGLAGQPAGNYLLSSWLPQLKAEPGALVYRAYSVRPIRARFPWKPRRAWMSRSAQWPPKGIELSLAFEGDGLEVTVHYELYDGLPLLGKWFTLVNKRAEPVVLNSFKVDILAAVEAESEVEGTAAPRLPNLHIEPELTSAAQTGMMGRAKVVQWKTDPSFATQVNYLLQTPCLLEVGMPLGPAALVASGGSFESFRSWTLVLDSRDEIRQRLSVARMHRTIAPWSQENPLIFHVRNAETSAVKAAIDQAVETGFELVILTFGSGFNIETTSEAELDRLKGLADYAHSKGIAIGGYSLLASRSISAVDDVVNPATGKPGGFAVFGNSPCICSQWGLAYMENLRRFYERTGMDVLEHDGSYPGDPCASNSHPGHKGWEDSVWAQWKQVSGLYQWARGRGIYLNVPDWYFLSGSSKTAMGYRETNWSLPRDLQEIIERQNIHDGLRTKTPTMGWMFVPLTEYHGGGPAATIEPLDQHIAHYERRLMNLLGAGVQACYRGPRLYDTERVKQMVSKRVAWFKANREILESDVVPLRRADGRDWDGLLHVLPGAELPALAMLYNPLPKPIKRTVDLPLRWAGLSGSALVQVEGRRARRVKLKQDGTASVAVEIPAQGWLEVKARA